VSESPLRPANAPPTDLGSALRALGPAAPLALAWSILPALLGIALVWRLSDAAAFFAEDPSTRVRWFVAAFAATSGVGLLPTYAQSALAGWVFGMPQGLFAAWMGFCGGAIVGYAIARVVARRHVLRLVAAFPKAAVVREALVGAGAMRAFTVVALVRLSPNSPFAMTNFALATSGVGFVPYVLGTAVGILPRTALVAGLAHYAARSGATSLGEFVSDGPGWLVLIGGIAVLIVVFTVLSRIARGALERAGLSTRSTPA
jgi:uncharacterized membrane protein YdjX (TVP38/TMEM64 family)